MDSPEGLLSRCFAEFYEELANIKVASAQGRLPSYLEGPNTPADIAAATATKLRALLAEQEKRVHAKANQTERQSYALARYFMAALADEVLGLTLDWEGGEHWQHHLLERHLFGRSIAGSQFYAQTDKVLNARGNDPLMTDLASVALMALQLGFQGQYWGEEGLAHRNRYRERLQQFIGAGGHTSLARPVFSAAYRGLISESKEQRLAPFSRWYYMAGGVAFLYLILSSAVWVDHMQDLRAVVPLGRLLYAHEITQVPATTPVATPARPVSTPRPEVTAPTPSTSISKPAMTAPAPAGPQQAQPQGIAPQPPTQKQPPAEEPAPAKPTAKPEVDPQPRPEIIVQVPAAQVVTTQPPIPQPSIAPTSSIDLVFREEVPPAAASPRYPGIPLTYDPGAGLKVSP